MTHLEIVKKIASETHVTRDKAREIIGLFVDILKEELQTEGKATLMGLGTLKTVTRAARKGRDPRSGDPIDIPEHKAVTFKASKSLVDDVQ